MDDSCLFKFVFVCEHYDNISSYNSQSAKLLFRLPNCSPPSLYGHVTFSGSPRPFLSSQSGLISPTVILKIKYSPLKKILSPQAINNNRSLTAVLLIRLRTRTTTIFFFRQITGRITGSKSFVSSL